MMSSVVTFPKLSRFERSEEPCSLAVPFPAGTVWDPSRFAIMDGATALPTQSLATAHWPDGSVKWLHADFLADLPGNAGRTFSWCSDCRAVPEPLHAVRFQPTPDGGVLDTGALRLGLGLPGSGGLFGDLDAVAWELDIAAIEGPFLEDEAGIVWTARLAEGGWRVLRSGPVHAIIEGCGRHVNAAGADLLDFRLRVHAFAGKPWLQLDYRIVNREEVPEVRVRNLGLRIRFRDVPGDVHTAVATSNYRTRVRRSDAGERMAHCITAEELIYESNEQVPEVLYGTFWADRTAVGRGGVAVSIHQAQQNFPKALATERSGMEVWLYPPDVGGLCLPRGVARTQRLLVHAHGGDVEASLSEVGIRSLQFQMPDRPLLPASVYRDAAVFEPVWSESPFGPVEMMLVDSADYRARGYGMLNWGDGPDANYTNQGRGHGKPVWTNNEYDLPHAAMLLFARNGERRFLDTMLVTAEHQLDVDVCHFSPDPLRQGGQITHSAHHVSGGVTPSHEWVEGLLDFYHVTADPTVLDAAVGIGENLLRQVQRPVFRETAASSARETGWALRAFAALYRETGELRWLAPVEFIVGQFRQWQSEYGAWLAPYTDHALVRVPFMISVAACSLMRVYWLNGDRAIAEMIVAAMRDLVEHALRPDGRFFYKELPSLERRGAGIYVLEGLAYAYDLSGDIAFIHAGLPTYKDYLERQRPVSIGTKYCVEDAVIWESGPSPKAFASAFHPLAMFARAAARAGLLG